MTRSNTRRATLPPFAISRYGRDVVFRRGKEERAEKRAREAAEVERLTALTPEALAAEVLPIVADAVNWRGGRATVREICRELVGAVSGRANLALSVPVREALQRLEHANLVLQSASAEMGSSWRITREGEQVAAADSIADKLGPSTS